MSGLIQEIFRENWDDFLQVYGHRVRQVVKEDVNRMINCGDISKGHRVYSCKCGETKKVAFTCKSRFCSSCGKVYVDNRADNMAKVLIKVRHRHMVFSIPEEFRVYFAENRDRLGILPRVAYDVLKRYFHKMNKKEEFTPGVVSVIHTFGRDLKWNPHVHLLVTEGAMGKITEWKKYDYFHYDRLRKSWQKGLITALRKTIKKKRREFDRLVNRLYAIYQDGFYVYGKRVVKNSKAAMKYVGRYTGRPAIANSRVIDYDGKSVTYYYDDHKTGKRIEEKVDVFEFMKRVIIHVADRGFKMIRYYGIYAQKRKNKCKVLKMLNEKLAEYHNKYKSWRKRIHLSFGHDPLLCPKCKSEMTLIDIYYPQIGSIMSLIHKREYEKMEQEVFELHQMNDTISKHYETPLYV
jgi:hypothetical protein